MRTVGTVYLRKDGMYVISIATRRRFRVFMLAMLARKIKVVIRLKGDEEK